MIGIMVHVAYILQTCYSTVTDSQSLLGEETVALLASIAADAMIYSHCESIEYSTITGSELFLWQE